MRERVGLCDVSTLGKIEVVGRDAAAFLDRLYTNMMSTLPVGRARYGLMLREDGFVMDDGTLARLDRERYVLSTTTANAVKVMGHMEFCAQVLWPELDVGFASVTEQWAQFAVAGPRSRETVAALLRPDFDLSNEAFPFMGAAALELRDGTPARLFRISFSGELAYEIAVPARFGDATARALMEAGAPFGIAPYGLEALSVLRIEKGHAAGGELNGQTTADDLGLGRMMSTKKDFIGAVMATRPALVDHERPSLVGFKPVTPGEPGRARAPTCCAPAPRTRPGTTKGTSRPGRFRRPSARSHWGCCAAVRSASANRCAPMIPCAAATRWSRCARRFSTTPKECGCVVEMVLDQRSPWSGLAEPGRFGIAAEQPGVRVGEPPALATALLVAHKGRLSDLLGAAKARGIELPTTPRQVSGPDVTALWNGPGQWLVRGSGSFADLAARLAVLAPFASWIDQSHSRAVLRVAGAHARDALAKGFEIDLHPRAFRAG